VALDLDGFGTGSGHGGAPDTTNGSITQRAVAYIHFENINPWLPTFYFGMDGPADISGYRQGSSNTSAQLEYDLLSRNNGFNTGRFGNGVGLRWDDLPLSQIGIPGRARMNFATATIGEGDDGLSSGKDRRSYSVYLQLEPFTQLKNKWLSGLGMSWGAWFCNLDDRAFDNACDELRIRDNGPGGRQDLFRSGPIESPGTMHFVTPSLGWKIGPYQFRAAGGWQRYEGEPIKGRNFLLANELMVWSPKGFLTGSYSDANTFYMGFEFERGDYYCGSNCNNGDEFKRARVLVREWDLWYVIQRGMNVGLVFYWYDDSNLRSGRGRSQENLLDKSTSTAGKGGDWLDVILAWRWQF
jgi:hypothetical protein